MKKLHIFVLKSFLGPFVVTFLISLFVLLMQFLWRYVEDLVGKGLEWYVVAKLMIFAASNLVQMALPLAVLLASLMTFGNLGEYYELTAIKAAGISLQNIMKPLIAFCFLIAVGAVLFANYVVPYTNLEMGSILYQVSHQRPEITIKSGIFNNSIEGFSIKVGKKSKTTNMMYDFMIYDHATTLGNPVVLLADSGTMVVTDDEKFMVVTLYNGSRYEESAEQNLADRKYPHRHDQFLKQTLVVELPDQDATKADKSLFKHNFNMLNLKQLSKAIDSLSRVFNARENSQVEIMKTNYYFRNEIKYLNSHDLESKMKDSAIRKTEIAKLPVPMKLDSVFEASTKEEKLKMLNMASEYADKAMASVTINYEELDDRGRWIRKHEIAWHTKFALSFACFLFFFIGAPLGAIIRKGGFGLPFIVAIVFFVLYYIVSMSGNKFVRENVMPAYIGIWISSLVIIPLGALFTWKATTDSALFNTDAYISVFQSIAKTTNVKKIFQMIVNIFSKKSEFTDISQ